MSNIEKTTTATDVKTETATKEKRTQISTTVSPAELEKLTDLRWEMRHDKMSDLVHAALVEYIEKHSA